MLYSYSERSGALIFYISWNLPHANHHVNKWWPELLTGNTVGGSNWYFMFHSVEM